MDILTVGLEALTQFEVPAVLQDTNLAREKVLLTNSASAGKRIIVHIRY